MPVVHVVYVNVLELMKPPSLVRAEIWPKPSAMWQVIDKYAVPSRHHRPTYDWSQRSNEKQLKSLIIHNRMDTDSTVRVKRSALSRGRMEFQSHESPINEAKWVNFYFTYLPRLFAFWWLDPHVVDLFSRPSSHSMLWPVVCAGTGWQLCDDFNFGYAKRHGDALSSGGLTTDSLQPASMDFHDFRQVRKIVMVAGTE